MIESIPHELRGYAQWVVWRYENKNDKLTKLPYDAKTGQLAAVDDPSTWCTFEIALAAFNTGMYDGLGFVLTENDPFTFIDLDMAEDAATLSRQIRIQEAFDTYSERSPSGKGLHIVCKGHVPSGRRRSNIEIYSNLRYMTVTGDVFDNKPINERQSLVQLLWSEMGQGTPIYSDIDAPQSEDDATIIQRASNAANGSKFLELMNGRWETLGYPSQSEADFALIDMLAFYTQNREQIVRIFRQSWLGQRKKANRIDYISTMVNRSFDRMLPQINYDSLKAKIDELMTGQLNGTFHAGTGVWGVAQNVPPVAATPSVGGNVGGGNGSLSLQKSNVKFPPGLMGEIAQFIFEASPRPVAEIALAASIGLMAGVCGRAYNTPTGAGLNLYTLLIALSGVGKEAMAGGISRLTEAVAKLQPGSASVPSVREFIGPSEIRSDAALIKEVERRPCMVSIISEFGLKLGAMHHEHANSHQKGLVSALLDLYTKSGAGNVSRAMVYSEQAKNTKEIQAPAFSILAESTPSTFYDILDETLIEQGLLPRFLIIEYLGIRVPSNKNQILVPSPQLMGHFGQLAAYCHTIMHNGRVITVQFADEEIWNLTNTFDLYCDAQINSTDRNTIRDLWSRAHLKALKLASLVAVGLDPYKPMLDRDCWLWALNIVETDTRRLIKRFEKGEIGSSNTNESIQVDEVIRVMRDWIFKTWQEVEKYNSGTPAMHAAHVIPGSYINKRLMNTKMFKNERIGSTNAINRAMKTLLDGGVISDVTAKAQFNIGGRNYMISDLRYLEPEV